MSKAGKNLCFSLGLALAIAASPASSQDSKTIYAPIDGFVLSIPFKNSIHEGSRSKAQLLYDNGRVASDLPPVHFEETELASYPLTATLRDKGLPASWENAPFSQSILQISSDLLEIQYQQEIIKYESAKARYELARKRYDLEVSLEDELLSSLTGAETYKSEVVREAYNRNRFHINHKGKQENCHSADGLKDCTGPTNATRMRDANAQRRAADERITKDRLEAELQQFKEALALAEMELRSAEKSLFAIGATLALGEVVCPVRCKIKRVHVVEGQYVNKGDPLVTFLWLAETKK